MSEVHSFSGDGSPPVARAAVLVAVPAGGAADREVEASLGEMTRLLRGLRVTVAARVVQRRAAPGAPAYVGEGKLRDIAALTGGSGELPRGPSAPPRTKSARAVADLVVVDGELSPAQQRNLELATAAEVLDRTAVILRVFELRARTRIARLEVELARLHYELPRIRDDHALGDREGGGGRAARGHTNVELAKRRARDRSAQLRRELAALQATAAAERGRREATFRVAIAGYTNAGKSSVMRLLTGSAVRVEDELFATVATTVRRLAPGAAPAILIADTVGFISRLPHALMASFRSTLDEVNEAALVLHVVDASDPDFRQHVAVTRSVLAEIGAAATPCWLLLNKVDRLDADQRAALVREFPEATPLSALRVEDGERLRERIVAHFDGMLVEATLSIPYAKYGVLAELREQLRVVAQEHGAEARVTLRATDDVLARLRSRLAARK